MATPQDCWSCHQDGRERAVDWLKSLKVGDELLHPSRDQDLNRTKPNGQDFETVSIKSIHFGDDDDDDDDKNGGFVMVSYPEQTSNWDRKLPLKYAFAVRPINSIQDEDEDEDEDQDQNQDEDENLSQSSSDSSTSSIVSAANIIPFPPQTIKNVKNQRHIVSFKIDGKKNNHNNKKKTKTLSSSNKNLWNSPKTTPKSRPKSPESTPPAASSTLYNKLHIIREKTTTHPISIQTYKDCAGSKNRRNRAIKQNSAKKRGNIVREEQYKTHQEKLAENKLKQQELEKNEKLEKPLSSKDENGSRFSGMNMNMRHHRDRDRNNRYISYTDDDDDENKGPMTRNRYHQQMQKSQICNGCHRDWMRKDAVLSQPVGLSNMGNTCFMNSTLQSLIHTEELRHFFLNNDKNKWLTEQLNRDNPIGYKGEIALNFSKLIYKSCEESTSGYYQVVTPRMIHYNLTGALRQFADYRQHDAQEFMTNFLDALHEDLNRIKKKKYFEIPDFDKYEESQQKKREFLHKRWHEIYLKRNNSVCTDLFAGLLKSTVTCPNCNFTAITFDPFMHLLVPLKAPRSMLPLFNSNYSYNKKKDNNYINNINHNDYDDYDDQHDDVNMNEEEEEYNELSFHLLPKTTDEAPKPFSIRISKEIQENNDWTKLHGLIYDHLLTEYIEQNQTDKIENDDADKIEMYREEMIKSPDFMEDEHYLYYGVNDVDKVKKYNKMEPRIPKHIDSSKLTDFPLFKLYELYQRDKILTLEDICREQYNFKISDYLNGSGIKRLIVQQLPSHWTDPQKKDQEIDQRINCYVVFKKPSRNKHDGDDDIDLKQQNEDEDETDIIPYEPFNCPRLIFDKGLTSKLDELQGQQQVIKWSKEITQSIAGDQITTKHFENEMEIRYCRKSDEYTLNKIDKWAKVMVNTSNSNNNSNYKPKPIKTLVIIFSFTMHQIYTQFQRENEEKLAKRERQKKYQTKKKREQQQRQQNDNKLNSKKRSFLTMNGGNSAYNNNGNNDQYPLNDQPRKRQRTDTNYNNRTRHNGHNGHYHNGYNGHDHNGYNSNHNNNNNNNDNNSNDVRDTSLPPEFQPTENTAKDIKQCFGMFLSREQLGRDNKWYCKKCKDHVQARKKLDLWWLPSHLIIAIKRFDNHGLRKYSNHVNYPVQGLDLSHIIRGRHSLDIYYNQHNISTDEINSKLRNETFIYDLYAVINHSGSLNFGHYTATIKFDDKWYDISDSNVSRSGANPISSSAYILCYKKR